MTKTKVKTARISRASIYHINQELLNYHATKKKLERTYEDIAEAHMSQSFDSQKTDVQNSIKWFDPTGNRGSALAIHAAVVYMTKIIDVIEEVYTIANDDQKKLIHLHYWRQPPLAMSRVAMELQVSEKSAYNYRYQVIELMAERLGWG